MKGWTWKIFWIEYNRLWNLKRYDLVLKHLLENYNQNWNYGFDLKYDQETKQWVEI